MRQISRVLVLLVLVSAHSSRAGRQQISLVPIGSDSLQHVDPVTGSSSDGRTLLSKDPPDNDSGTKVVLYDAPMLLWDLLSFPYKMCMGPNRYVGHPLRRCVEVAAAKANELDTYGYGRNVTDSDDLKACLERAELIIDGRKTAIIVPFNAGFVDLAEHILCSLKSHGTDRVLFWALDERAYRLGKQRNMNVYYDSAGAHIRKKVWGNNPEFFEIMAERPRFWGAVLEAGYDMLFVDADVVFLWDPRDAISHALHNRFANMDIDLIMSVDEFNVIVKPSYAVRDVDGCAGFFYMRANERTVLLMKRMELFLTMFMHLLSQGIKFPLWSWNDQTALNWFIREDRNCRYDPLTREDMVRGDDVGEGRRISCKGRPGVRVGYFDQYHYVNGHVFWSSDQMQTVLQQTGPQWSPVVVHANGRANKLVAFRDKGLLQFKNLTDRTCKAGFTPQPLSFGQHWTQQM